MNYDALANRYIGYHLHIRNCGNGWRGEKVYMKYPESYRTGKTAEKDLAEYRKRNPGRRKGLYTIQKHREAYDRQEPKPHLARAR